MRRRERDEFLPRTGESRVLESLAHRLTSLTGAEGVAIALREPGGLVCRGSVGNAPAMGSKVGAESRFTQECLTKGQVVTCRDTMIDSRFKTAAAGGVPFRSAVAIPIQARGAVLGVIALFSSRPLVFGAQQVEAAQRHAALLGFLLEPVDVPDATNVPKEERAPVAQEREGRVLMFPAVPSVPAETTWVGRWWRLDPTAARICVAAVLTCLTVVGIVAAARHWGSVGTTRATKQAAITTAGQAPGRATESIAKDEQSVSSEQLAHRVNTTGLAEPGKEATGSRERRSDTAGQNEPLRRRVETATLPRSIPPNQPAQRGPETPTPPETALVASAAPAELPVLAPSTAYLIAAAPVVRASAGGFVLDRTLKGHSGWVTAVAFSPDGRRLASGSWDRTVKFWDVSTGETVGNIGEKSGRIQALAFSGDGRWLATESFANEVTLWDAHTGMPVRRLAGSKPIGLFGTNYVYSIDFSPDGRWLASGLDDKTVRVWDVTTGQVVRDLKGSPRTVIYIAFSPDGRLLATGDDDKTISIWDLKTGRVMHRLAGHQDQVYAAQFSPDGRRVASASRDKTVRLWDVASGRELRRLGGHRKSVTSLAFSPDGRMLASGSWDDTVKLWNVESGREMQTLAGHTHHVYSVAFDSDGRRLASGSEDGTMKLWRSR
jgi:WD40 repeat protein